MLVSLGQMTCRASRFVRVAPVLLFLLFAGAAAEATDTDGFHIDNERSWIRVLVYRGGLLGGLGHNHVVSHHNIDGLVSLDDGATAASVELRFKVDEFVIDDPALRAAEGDDFPGAMTQKDIDGTRKNMLGRKLLHSEDFPVISVRTSVDMASLGTTTLDVLATVKGREFSLSVPATIRYDGTTFVATGEMSILHSDIGLKPFKAALGALRVHKSMQLKFEVHGSRVSVAP